MIKTLKNEKGFERYCIEMNKTKTIDVTEYCSLGDSEFVCGGFTFDIKRADRSKFKNCETAEELVELIYSHGFNITRKSNY